MIVNRNEDAQTGTTYNMKSTRETAKRYRPSLPLALYSASVATALLVVTIAQIVGFA